MTSRLRLLVCLGALFPAFAFANAPASDVTRAAYLLVLGQAPAMADAGADFTKTWESATALLEKDRGMQAAVAAKARADAFGSVALDAPASAALTYTAQVQDHVAWLADHPAAYEKVIQAAYRFVINRDVYAEEITYWHDQPAPLSYALLVACIEDWARRNQPGLMVTAGTPTVSINCEFLATARLSPADAATARELAGLPAVTQPGNHVLAAGAAHLKSAGGIRCVAAGGPLLAGE